MKKPGTSGLVLTDVPIPQPGPADVLVKVLRTGICGTDLHIADWDRWAQDAVAAPLIVGHEMVGRVVETGSGVTDVVLGDLVSVEGHIVCGRCRNCLAGRRHLCIRTVGIGVQRDGAFSEYVAVPATNVWVHRHEVPLDVAAIFDPFGNAVHTALQWPVVGEDVLVTGAGPIGIMAAAVVRHAGARHVVITDISGFRLDLARRMGVSLAVDVSSTALESAQAELDMREGFDVGLEMSGQPAALQQMVANLTHGGRIAMLGLPSEEITLDWGKVVTHMLTIKGIYGREIFETWYAMSVLLQAGLDISPIITGRFGYADHVEAFAAARGGHCGKIVLDWTRPHLR
ncbi:MAG: L-threonine 3-dehydrogenase [Mycobacteriales bacterium]